VPANGNAPGSNASNRPCKSVHGAAGRLLTLAAKVIGRSLALDDEIAVPDEPEKKDRH
jgi:hypothetical protein